MVGDAEGVANLLPHRVAETLEDAVRASYDAGLDVEMGGTPAAIALDAASLDPSRLDDAVARVLGMKEALGLFDRPYVDEAAELVEPTEQTRAQARLAAARSAVLLRNDGTLPLATPARVLLTGPYATSTDHLGAWTQAFSARSMSIADALRARGDLEVVVAEGVSFFGDRSDDVDAVATAALESDVVVVCVGEPSSLSGEAASRSDLRLPGRQADLISAIAGTGIPFVVVLANGRPLVVADWIDHAPAVLEVWHGGTEAPAAIVDLLFGDQEPAGRLPMSFPRSEGQIPIYYAYENTGRPATVRGTMTVESVDVMIEGPANVKDKYTSKYLDLDLGPQFAFGHGSGYATFAHGEPRISAAAIRAGGTVVLEIDVTNTSVRAGDEVLQVYVEDLVASISPPVRRLVAFERRTLPPGGTTTFSFEIGPDQLGFWLADGTFTVELGGFVLHVGPTLEHTQPVTLTVTE